MGEYDTLCHGTHQHITLLFVIRSVLWWLKTTSPFFRNSLTRGVTLLIGSWEIRLRSWLLQPGYNFIRLYNKIRKRLDKYFIWEYLLSLCFPVESCLCNRRRTPCRKRKTITGDALFFIVGEKIVVEKDTDVWLCNRLPVRPIYRLG